MPQPDWESIVHGASVGLNSANDGCFFYSPSSLQGQWTPASTTVLGRRPNRHKGLPGVAGRHSWAWQTHRQRRDGVSLMSPHQITSIETRAFRPTPRLEVDNDDKITRGLSVSATPDTYFPSSSVVGLSPGMMCPPVSKARWRQVV